MTEPTQTKPKVARWMRPLLVVSLAVNLLVAGLAVGFFTYGKPNARLAPPPKDMAAPYTKSLAEADKRALWRKLRGQFDGPHLPRRQILEEYSKAVTLLRSDPYDAEALTALLTDQGRRAQNRMVAGQQVLASFISEMSLEDRAAYADRLEIEIKNLAERKPRLTGRHSRP